jgi:type IV pilus assembly protein PilY1
MKRVLYSQSIWVALALWAGSLASWADDTELYIYDYTDSDYSSKLLLIFDTSGSMSTNSLLVKKDYDPDSSYDAIIGLEDSALYFKVDDEDIPSGSDSHSFLWSVNNCATSYESLQTYGYYIGYLKEHRYQGTTGSWSDLRTSENVIFSIIDCPDDFYLEANDEGVLGTALGANTNYSGNYIATQLNPAIDALQGQMVDGAVSNDDVPVYYDIDATESSGYTSGEVFTVYTANYLRWYHEEEDSHTGADSNVVYKTRLAVAKGAVNELVETTTNANFGLMRFNYNSNSSNNGGYLLSGIQSYSDAATFTALVDDLPGNGYTPLTETLYEAKQYMQGGTVINGDRVGHDTGIVNDGVYSSPFSSTCDEQISIVYITDGAPTLDSSVDDAIQRLSVSSSDNSDCEGASVVSGCSNGYASETGYGDYGSTSALPILAAWMHDNDLISPDDADDETRQTTNLYTIGFGDDAIADAEELLSEAAERGGGYYSAATDSNELKAALQNALIDTYESASSLVSPSITSSNADRTESLDRVYYSMFEPSVGPRWSGNLKKLSVSDEGYTVDKYGHPAIDSEGVILDSATTYWSSSIDGHSVASGGVVEMLSAKTDRILYYDDTAGETPELKLFNQTNLEATAGGANALVSHLGVDSSELRNILSWIEGLDVDDEDGDGSVTDNRSDIMADPLHSSPLVINYGGQSDDALDVRILVGTNAGVLHMFKDAGDSVDESWAFIAYDKLANQRLLRTNATSTTHLYGIDSSPVVYKYDADGDGIYKSSDGDKVWLFVGQRRGGDNYYGFDISDPDAPSLMWTLNRDSSGLSELGLSWSAPAVVDEIPGYHADTERYEDYERAALVIGAGYDTNKDASSPEDDDRGRGVFIVSAQTGSLIHSFTPAASTTAVGASHSYIGFTDAMPGVPAVLDSDGDGKTDRIYIGDTGGSIWRLDMYSSDTSAWGGYELASLGDAESDANDRRFFNEVAIVRTYYKSAELVTLANSDTSYYNYTYIPIDGLLIGSGDETRPRSDSSVENQFFFLRDTQVDAIDYSSGSSSSTIEMDDLYDITENPMYGISGSALIAQELLLSAAKGWRYQLEERGEKSLGSGLVLEGVLYFTSYMPPSTTNECEISSVGSSRLYSIDMHTGTSSNSSSEVRYVTVDNAVLSELVLYSDNVETTDAEGNTVIETSLRLFGGSSGDSIVVDDGDDSSTSDCESSGNCSEGSESTDTSLATEQIYLYFKESQ